MAFTVTPTIGIDMVNTVLGTDIASGARAIPGLLGTEVFASDGKIYVLAKANATIAGATAVCTVNAVTFLAIASGGAYTSPATAMVTGDYGWFSKASV